MNVSRISEKFRSLRSDHRTGLVVFLTVGYPDLESTMRLVPALVDAGADIVELGIPFSDPLADGATIQRASFAALESGVTPSLCLETVAQLRRQGVTAPLVLMGYYNPILAAGEGQFAADAAAAGADGLIVVDLPPEESDTLLGGCRDSGLDLVYLVAPTSTEARIRSVAERSSGFIYCVSLTGVTGARGQLPSHLPEFLGRVRAETDLPLAVGFGISRPEHFRAVGEVADAAVVGSAIVDLIDRSDPTERESRLKEYVEMVTGRAKSVD